MVADRAEDIARLSTIMAKSTSVLFSVRHAKALDQAVRHLAGKGADIILLDLTLENSSGVDMIKALQRNSPRSAFVALADTDDENVAAEAIRRGAQDYLVKDRIESELLMRSIFYAMERKHDGVLQDYADRLEILHELDKVILSAQSPRTIAQAALSHIRQLVPCSMANVLMYDFRNRNATVLATQTDGKTSLGRGVIVPLSGLPDAKLLRQGKVSIIEDISSLPEMPLVFQTLATEGVRSYVSIPLLSKGELIGSLNLGNENAGQFSSQHLILVYQLADQLAIAIRDARLLEQLRQSEGRLKALSRQLVSIQETERRNIARELHDEIGQSLTALKINMQMAQRLSQSDEMAVQLREGLSIVDHTLEQVHNLALALRPAVLDDLGLVSALRWLVNRQSERAGLEGTFTTSALGTRLPSDIETTCFRVSQEALTNIMRHAQAHHVDVDLRLRDLQLELTICDDGLGFDLESARYRGRNGTSLGLIGMRERVELTGGELTIQSAPGQGTTVRASFFLPPNNEHTDEDEGIYHGEDSITPG
ncbi:MAG: ATP-binding protein [Chloroflexota bacterium]